VTSPAPRERVAIWVGDSWPNGAGAEIAATVAAGAVEVVANVELPGVQATVIDVDRDRYGRAAELFCVKALVASLLAARADGAEVRIEVFGSRADPGVGHLIANATRSSISGALHPPRRRRR
jgi:hypothetical protein